jgi:hypothetical protein
VAPVRPRTIDPSKCHAGITVLGHYNDNGSCKCNDWDGPPKSTPEQINAALKRAKAKVKPAAPYQSDRKQLAEYREKKRQARKEQK